LRRLNEDRTLAFDIDGTLAFDKHRTLSFNNHRTLADDDRPLVHVTVLVAMIMAPLLMAPVFVVAVAVVIVGLGPAGSGEEEKTGAESGADEMAETHWAIPPLTSEGTQSNSRFIPKKIEALL